MSIFWTVLSYQFRLNHSRWFGCGGSTVNINTCVRVHLHTLPHTIFIPWKSREWIAVVQSLSRVWFFVTPWTAARQDSYPSPSPRVCSSLRPLSWWCHLVLCSPLLLLPSVFPSIRAFLVSWLFTSGGQSIDASASVLPMNIHDWSPLGLTGLISLQSKGLSRVFSNTTVQKHQFFSAQLSLRPNLSYIHDYWENHSFDYMDFCRQSNISAF